jgi:hypothetical protein
LPRASPGRHSGAIGAAEAVTDRRKVRRSPVFRPDRPPGRPALPPAPNPKGDRMRDDVDTPTLAQLAKRVQELEAAHELTSLRAEFHRCLNNSEWDALAALFTSDAHLDYGEYGQAHGTDEVRYYYSNLLEKIRASKDATAISLKNFVHGHQVQVHDDDTASGVCFDEEQIRFNQDRHAFSSVGQFTDEYVRHDGRWQFQRVRLDHYWVIPDNDGWQWPW